MTTNQELRLFPNYYKKIAICVALCTIGLCITLFCIKSFTSYNLVIMETTKHITILSLLGIAFSKDKIEDELVMHIRLRSLVLAFYSGVLFSISFPITSYFLNGVYNSTVEAYTVLIFMFIFYFLMFYYLKRKR
jgi:hypothetical protein